MPAQLARIYPETRPIAIPSLMSRVVSRPDCARLYLSRADGRRSHSLSKQVGCQPIRPKHAGSIGERVHEFKPFGLDPFDVTIGFETGTTHFVTFERENARPYRRRGSGSR
jgi:hypothetical protein